MADWDSERIEQSHLRERLNDIAADVSRLVYAVDGELPDSDSTGLGRLGAAPESVEQGSGTVHPLAETGAGVASRLTALRDIQSRA